MKLFGKTGFGKGSVLLLIASFFTGLGAPGRPTLARSPKGPSATTKASAAAPKAATGNADHSPRGQAAASRRPLPDGSGRRTAALADYGKLPLAFEPNRGQTDRRVQFLSHGPGYTLFLTADGAVLKLESRSQSFPQSGISGHFRGTTDNGPRTTDVVRLTLEGANPAAAMRGSDELPGKTNYFLGNDPAKWLHEIPTYGRVVAAEVYPGIGLTYYGTPSRPGQLEYDFVVAPGADPRAITLAVASIYDRRNGGHRPPLQIAANGDVVVKVGGKELRFLRPVVYQEQEPGVRSQKSGAGQGATDVFNRQSAIGNRKYVEGRYVLLARNRLGFQIPQYDKTRPLIIDPVLSYSTFLGGSGIDVANGIAVGSDGTAFIAGGTSSADFPVAHPLQPDAGGPTDFPQDAFVSKLSADGSTLLYSTYLGGKLTDVANGITVDTFGNAYITGTTESDDFPFSIGSFKPNCGCDGKCNTTLNANGLLNSDGFVVKLNPAGSAIDYSGAISGKGNTQGLGIAVDNNGNAYATGTTDAVACSDTLFPFPWLTNGFQTSLAGSADGFIVKIDPTGSSVPYASYLGGSGEDDGFGIAADNSNNAYVTGLTCSANFPVLIALQPLYHGNCDAFVTIANTVVTGAASLLYSSFLGGGQRDQGNAISLDAGHTGSAVYVTGLTNSTDFPTTLGVIQPTCALNALGICGGDAFVTSQSFAGVPAFTYSTYLGGTGADSGAGIAVDTGGNAYVTGITNSTNFPTAGTPFQATYGGGNSDAFVAKLNPTATALLYSTFLGGSNADNGTAIAVDMVGNAYVTGQTCSTNFPTHLPEQATPGGNCDAFVSKVLVGPDISISPTSLVFPAQSLGTTSSPPKIITLTSNGDSSLIIGAISVSGEFIIVSDGCSGQTLAPSSSCDISLSFKPTSSGPQSGTLTIPDNVTGSPQTVPLSGLVTNVFVLPPQLGFGNQLVGTTSSPMAATLTNAGATPLSVSSITATGDFAVPADACGPTLAPGANCTISVTFTPTAPGIRLGTLTVTDSDSSSPQTVSLTGHGNAPSVTVSPASLNFGTQSATGPPQTVTLTNNGDGALSILSITFAGPYAEDAVTTTCGTTLVAGAACTIGVDFLPIAPGTFPGTLTVTDNNAGVNGSTQSVNLSGTAVVPVASIAPVSLNFGSVIIGTASAPQTVTLTNTGNTSLTVASAMVSANYSVTNNCVVPLPANTSCTLDVTFAPASQGSLAGSLIITDNAPGSPQSVGLTGLGIAKFVTVAPAALSFGNQLINTSTSPMTVTLTNTGNGPVSITGINIGGTDPGDFAETNTCGASLAGNSSCTVSVTFTPTASGIRTGTLTMTDSDPSSPQTVSLTGNGTAPVVSLSPTTLNFGNQGATGTAQAVTLTNTGNGLLNIVSITASAQFSQTNNCPASIAPAGVCTITVSFLPTGSGAVTGTLAVADNAAGSPQSITLSGNGILPVATLSPASLTFPSEPAGVTSSGQAVTLTNTGTATLNITSITISGDFAETNTCSASLAPSGACSINITFTPTGLGARTGTLSIADNAAGSPQTVALSGSGGDFAMAVAPPSANFFAGQSASFTVTITPSFGFNGKVSLGCSGLPAQSSCVFSPVSVTLDGVNPSNVNLTVNTTARVTAPPRARPRPAPPALPWKVLPLAWLALALLATAAVSKTLSAVGGWTARGRRAGLVLAMALVMALSWFACGGGSPVNAPTGTPAGTYTITISGASGNVNRNATATLTVK